MMRAPHSFAVVVRRADGTLRVRERPMEAGPGGVRKWPLVRGVMSLVESLTLGMEALRFSAEHYSEDYDQREASKASASRPSVLSALALTVFALATKDVEEAAGSGGKAASTAPESGPQAIAAAPSNSTNASNAAKGANESQSGDQGTRAMMGLMLVMVIGFFIALPQGAAAGINRLFNLGLEVQSPGFQAITGVLKLCIVIGYMTLVRRTTEMRRVFQYHGAEHKTISTYEAGEELTVANARAKTTLHPRCGTTFIVMVALMSIVVFTLVGSLLPRIETGSAVLDNVIFFFEKLPFLPLIAAGTFELQRLFARYCTTGPLRVLLWPGFLVQKITTVEPDDAQLEVALGSLRATLFREEGYETGDSVEDVAFENYEALLTAERLRPAPALAA
jgi:uncharacterized protein YqhQ